MHLQLPILFSYLVTVIYSDCAINPNPQDIHSGSFIASSTSAGDLQITTSSSMYTYNLPTTFNNSPQIAISTNIIEAQLAGSMFYKITGTTTTSQVKLLLNTSTPTSSWQYFRVMFLVTNRADMELGHYEADFSKGNSFFVSTAKNLSNAIGMPFVSGLLVGQISTSKIPSYFKINSFKFCSGGLQFELSTNSLKTVNIDYIVYDSVNLTKIYKVAIGNVRLGANNVGKNSLDAGTTRLFGYNGFMLGKQNTLSYSSQLFKNLSLSVITSTLSDISLSYFVVQSAAQEYCRNCLSGSIISDAYCVNLCPPATVTLAYQSVRICVVCDISKFMVSNQPNTGCLCAAQYYRPKGADRCQPCDFTCLTCSGSTSKNCLSCLTSAGRQLKSNSCVISNVLSTNDNAGNLIEGNIASIINPVSSTSNETLLPATSSSGGKNSNNNTVRLNITSIQVKTNRVVVSVRVDPIPKAILADNCKRCTDLVRVSLKTGAAPSLTIAYKEPDTLVMSLEFKQGVVNPFSVGLSVNPDFGVYYPAMDISTSLAVNVTSQMIQ